MDLYYMPTCPHCHKVMDWIRENDDSAKFNYYDVTADEAAADRLMRLEGGKGYVPCLDADGRAIIGDGPIIEYLERQL